jgi:uncharacterized cupredoxin-like copper-binding protein
MIGVTFMGNSDGMLGRIDTNKERDTRQQLRVGLTALAVLSLVIGACGDGDEASTDLEVTTTDFQFSPDSWTVPAGEEISIDITNDGSVLHEWVLMQPGVNIDSEADLPDTEEELLAEFVYVEDEVEAGANKTLTFTAPDVGTYQVICAIESHFDAGMEGSLTVVEAEGGS